MMTSPQTHRSPMLPTLCLALLTLAAPSAWAEDAPSIKTYPEDLGYGEQPVPADAHFDELDQRMGPVDARAELNPLAGRLIAWPTATLQDQGTWSYRTVAFVEHRLYFSPRQGTELRVSSVWPGISQYYLGLGARFSIFDAPNASLTWGPSARYRRSGFNPGTSDLSLGLELIADIPISDRSVFTVGAALNVVAALGYQAVDPSTCQTRYDYGQGDCYFENTEPRWEFPSGGHWGALFVGTNTHVTDYLVFNLEAFTGAGSGTFMELNDFFTQAPTYTDELAGFTQGELRAGLELFGPLTVGMGTTWIAGSLAMQTSVMITRFQGQVRPVPFLSLAYQGGR